MCECVWFSLYRQLLEAHITDGTKARQWREWAGGGALDQKLIRTLSLLPLLDSCFNHGGATSEAKHQLPAEASPVKQRAVKPEGVTVCTKTNRLRSSTKQRGHCPTGRLLLPCFVIWNPKTVSDTIHNDKSTTKCRHISNSVTQLCQPIPFYSFTSVNVPMISLGSIYDSFFIKMRTTEPS